VDELKASGKPFRISKQEVWDAWLKVKGNQGAPGVDGQSIEAFEKDLKDNLYRIWNRMSSGTYFPPPVMAVEIPRPHGGGTRVLGVPCVADRIAQTVAAARLDGALVVVSADDPGMASSQNEQDNRRYALAAGVAMLEPSDSQEAYEFTVRAIEISERWQAPVLLRLTTRVCHSKSVVRRGTVTVPPPGEAHFEHDLPSRAMIPTYARPAHPRLRKKLAEMAAWNDEAGPNQLISGSTKLGIITSGVSFLHVREVAPEASVLKIGMTYPLPVERMRAFAAGVERCIVIEEGEPYLVEGARAACIAAAENVGWPGLWRPAMRAVDLCRRAAQLAEESAGVA